MDRGLSRLELAPRKRLPLGYSAPLAVDTWTQDCGTRTTPLGFLEEGDRGIVAASQLGLSKDPLRYKNLQVHPECRVQIKRSKMKMQARTAAPEERAHLRPKLVARYSGFAASAQYARLRRPGQDGERPPDQKLYSQ